MPHDRAVHIIADGGPIKAAKKVMLSDFAHHLPESFPGMRLEFYERLAPNEA